MGRLGLALGRSGLAGGSSAVYNPSTVTYLSGTQQRIYAFAQADNGHLVVNYWDGFAWHWADQGLPNASTGVYTPNAITYLSGTQRIYVFAQASSGHLVVNYWDGSAWHWADQGLSAGTSTVYSPSAITYLNGTQQRIYVFAQGSNAHLVVNYWDGFAWHWADQGLPSGSAAVYYPSAMTYLNGSTQLIYVFGEANTNHLVVNYWTGSAWFWADQGSL